MTIYKYIIDKILLKVLEGAIQNNPVLSPKGKSVRRAYLKKQLEKMQKTVIGVLVRGTMDIPGLTDIPEITPAMKIDMLKLDECAKLDILIQIEEELNAKEHQLIELAFAEDFETVEGMIIFFKGYIISQLEQL
ncbi:hypothetical protein H7170_03980 [Candidatus Gracilibacteria bacterium]|nr:hypothetical protein [Candidatus Gracilibacteria bacterium]